MPRGPGLPLSAGFTSLRRRPVDQIHTGYDEGGHCQERVAKRHVEEDEAYQDGGQGHRGDVGRNPAGLTRPHEGEPDHLRERNLHQPRGRRAVSARRGTQRPRDLRRIGQGDYKTLLAFFAG
jgi:hypothetical protein